MLEGEIQLESQENELLNQLRVSNEDLIAQKQDAALGLYPGLGLLIGDTVGTIPSKIAEITAGQPMTVGGFMGFLGVIVLGVGITAAGLGLHELRIANNGMKDNNKMIDHIYTVRGKRAALKA